MPLRNIERIQAANSLDGQAVQELKASLAAHREILFSMFAEYRACYSASDIARVNAELRRTAQKHNAPSDCFDAARDALGIFS